MWYILCTEYHCVRFYLLLHNRAPFFAGRDTAKVTIPARNINSMISLKEFRDN